MIKERCLSQLVSETNNGMALKPKSLISIVIVIIIIIIPFYSFQGWFHWASLLKKILSAAGFGWRALVLFPEPFTSNHLWEVFEALWLEILSLSHCSCSVLYKYLNIDWKRCWHSGAAPAIPVFWPQSYKLIFNALYLSQWIFQSFM